MDLVLEDRNSVTEMASSLWYLHKIKAKKYEQKRTEAHGASKTYFVSAAGTIGGKNLIL